MTTSTLQPFPRQPAAQHTDAFTVAGLARATLVLRDIAGSWPPPTRAARLATLWSGIEHDLLRAWSDGRLRLARSVPDVPGVVRVTVQLMAAAAEDPSPESPTLLSDLTRDLRRLWSDV